MHVKWWDYSNDFLNINGRTCLFYAICWGFLSIGLINYVHPIIDRVIDSIYKKISSFLIKSTVAVITIFMTIDGFISVIAIDNFLLRVASQYEIKINGVEEKEFDKLALVKNFSNEKMMMTYPNIIIVNENEENIYLETVLKDIKNYYYKIIP